jgi:hypothetical protein
MTMGPRFSTVYGTWRSRHAVPASALKAAATSGACVCASNADRYSTCCPDSSAAQCCLPTPGGACGGASGAAPAARWRHSAAQAASGMCSSRCASRSCTATLVSPPQRSARMSQTFTRVSTSSARPGNVALRTSTAAGHTPLAACAALNAAAARSAHAAPWHCKSASDVANSVCDVCKQRPYNVPQSLAHPAPARRCCSRPRRRQDRFRLQARCAFCRSLAALTWYAVARAGARGSSARAL